jgi:multiple sugar transport system permease protein
MVSSATTTTKKSWTDLFKSKKPAQPKRPLSRSQKTENIAGWLFALPLVIGLLLFTAVPMVCSLVWSFFDYNGINKMNFVGFGMFVKAFNDPVMGKVTLNTFLFALINVPLNLILSYLLALLVNNKHKFTKFFRVIYYLPVVIPAVVGGLLWKDIFDNTYGIFNKILTSIGLPAFAFFSEASTSLFSLLLMGCWGIGGGMILWLSAFKNIPNSLYESATIDGANSWQKFVHITIPMSSPIIFFNLVTSVIGSLQYNGTLIFAPRNGRGVDDSLFLYGVKIYWEGFRTGNIGYACALSWLLCIVISGLTLVLFKSSKWVFYGGE